MKYYWNKIYQDGSLQDSSMELHLILSILKKKILKNKKVLDIGCGTGSNAVKMAKLGYKVCGFDISHEAIRTAKKFAKKNGVSVDFIQGSMHKKFPYNDDEFDALICLRTLNHGRIKQINFTVREMYRSLAPGGFIFVSVQKIWGKKKIMGDAIYNNMPVKIIEPYTYMPQEGREQGIIHYSFTKNSLQHVFHRFCIQDIKVILGHQAWERYYFLVASKK